MKLTQLGNTTQRPVTEGGVRPHPADGERVRRVEALDASESDRQRSLQQEMAEIEAEAIADFAGATKSCKTPAPWPNNWRHWARRPMN